MKCFNIDVTLIVLLCNKIEALILTEFSKIRKYRKQIIGIDICCCIKEDGRISRATLVPIKQ